MSIEELGKPTIREIDKHLATVERERDHFKASYARKLVEHEKTLADAAQLCTERDEARANLAQTQAQAALLREALKYYAREIYWHTGSMITRSVFCPPSRPGKLEELHGYEVAKEALAATPADALAQVREQAGLERAAKELDGLIAQTKRFGHTVKLAASSESWDFSTREELALLLSLLEQRRAEIAAELRGGK